MQDPEHAGENQCSTCSEQAMNGFRFCRGCYRELNRVA